MSKIVNLQGNPVGEEPLGLVSPTGAPLTPAAVPQVLLNPFDDGYVLKFGPHPTDPSAGFVLFDNSVPPKVVALVLRAEVAEMLCTALALVHRAQQPQGPEVVGHPDNPVAQNS